MNGKQLKNSILQWAIQGKLVPQDPNDEPASVLLEKIRQEKERLIKEKKIKRDKNTSIIYRGEDNSYYEKMLTTGEVKCIDEEIPFEIPKGWEWCRVTDLMTKITDGTHRSPTNTDNGEYMYITAKNIKETGISLANVTFVSKDVHDEIYSRCNPEYGDLLYIKDGATTGIATINNIKEPFSLLSSVALLKPTSKINANYILYFLRTPLNVENVRGSMKGCAITRITLRQIEKWLVPVPPQGEQQRIVALINELLPYLDKYSALQNKLDSLNININDKLKKAILQEAIQGKLVPQISEEGTAQELLEQIKTEKQKLVKEGKSKRAALNDSVIFRGDDNKYYEQIGKKCLDITEQIPFEIPNNWKWCRVCNVSNSYIGLTYRPTDIDDKGTIVLRSCNIRNGKLALDDIVRVSSSISEKLLIEENDIVICARNGSKRLVGKSALIKNMSEPMTFGAFMAICKTPIYEYMFAYLQSDLFFGQLRDVSNTTTINQLTQNKFNDFLIPIPPIKEQKRIVFKINQLFQELR